MRAFSQPSGPVPPGAWAGRVLPLTGGRGWVLLAAMGTLGYMSARLALSAPPPGADPELGDVNPANTVLQLVLLGFGIVHALRYPRETLRTMRQAWPFVLVVMVAAASVLWSQAPAATMRRAAALGTLVLFAAAILHRLGLERFMRVVVGTTILASIAGLAEAVLRPELGFDTGEYANAIRGIFFQKNNFGFALLAGTLALSFLILERGRPRAWDVAIFLFLLVMLVLSRSTTALLLSVAVTGGTVVALGLDRGGAWTAATLVLMAVGGTLALLAITLLGPSGLFEAVGKDDTLTGRTYIWAEVRHAISLRPYLGYGYNAFWLHGSHAAELLHQRVGWQAPTAHSGYLDVTLQLGMFGPALVLLLNAITIWRAILAMRDGYRRRAFWVLILSTVYAIYNYSESLLLRPDLQFLLWTLAAISVAPVPLRQDAGQWKGPWSFRSSGQARTIIH
ncbi:O-antigen ligase family protein [Roseococcus sp. YIM B11640]|uniref:O-antigen ligase family protein n=1 Tax=Roseococcus sp. YIM B11640 TaxID=3133973 RepID=UPI003C7CD191